ncbi:MAG: hypothetical protein JJU37_05700 [Balneolaceae bacterium]|nr:hypothetical protein [Balneolaceae bacterium]
MKFFLLALLFFVSFTSGAAQTQTHTSFETSALISSEGTTPFWLQSNRYGMYSQNGSQFFTRFQYHSSIDDLGPFDILYGADLIARPAINSTINFNQGYLKLRAYGFELAAGRFHNTSPLHDEELSMGSLGVSANANPIPQVRIGLYDWTSIPFTNDFIEIRGHLSHGWLGSRRFTDDVLLHEKVGHLRVGGDLPVNLYGGLAHYAKWGGNNHPVDGDIPARLSDWWNVFFALGGDEFTPGAEQAYALGDHLGAWDLGFYLNLDDVNVKVYRQFPLETKDNLKFKSPQDALTGISFEFSENVRLPFDRFLYEFLYTKFQDGARRPNIVNGRNCVENPDPTICRDNYRGNEDYYNHGLYRTGWAYNFRTIGNPLFILNEENLGIVNNRIVGHHVGFVSTFGDVQLTGKATYSRNYGKYCDNRIPDIGEGELFGIRCENIVDTIGGRMIEQWSFMASSVIPLNLSELPNLSLLFELAFDNGALVGDQFGGLIGIRWNPN